MYRPSQTLLNRSLLALATIVLIRLVTLGLPDLLDSTEGRYASIAKLMLDRDDWVTPWINFHGEEKPYLGKPPLHFWLMDISYLTFGLNNFSARLPSFISAVGIGVLLATLSATLFGGAAAYLATLIFASSTIIFYLSGAAVLDITLTFGITMALVSFLLADRSRYWGYLFFIGLGLGVLVKGPIAVILAGCTIAPWLLIRRWGTGHWPPQLRSLPWIVGPLLFLATTLPWYLWAEHRNPGFLKYFFWNENFGRFFSKEYGDEYGVGHQQPVGIAWLMMLPALFPWSLILIALLVALRKKLFTRAALTALKHDPILLYALIWAISCPALLTAARQYTATYVVPSIPGFALLAVVLWRRQAEESELTGAATTKILKWAYLLLAVTLMILPIVLILKYDSDRSSAVAGFIAGALLLALGIKTSVLEKPIAALTRITIYSAILYGFATLCLDNNLSNNRSSLRVLTLASSLAKPDSTLSVGFPFYFPFSATFYGPLMTSPNMTIVQLDDEQVLLPPTDLIAVRRRNEAELLELDPAKQKLAEVGQWRIYRGSGSNIKN